MTITIEPMDPALEAYLLDLGEDAWNLGFTVMEYLHNERITVDYADAHVVHQGWIRGRNKWQSNLPYTYN